MKSSFQTVIDLPAERIDLPSWLAMLSDRDYQSCSPSHRAAGTFYENGVFGSVNVESIGGHLLIQHYLAEDATAQRIVMRSRNTRVYVLHLAPATIEIIWTVEIKRQDSESSLFCCAVEVHMQPLLFFVATAALLPLFLRWHVQGETGLFAADLTRKVADGQL